MSGRFLGPVQFRMRGDAEACTRLVKYARLLAGSLQNKIETGPPGVTHRVGRVQVDMGGGLFGDIMAMVMVGPHNNWTAFVDLSSFTTVATKDGTPDITVPTEYDYHMDSGYLSIGFYNTNPVSEYVVERPVLYQGTKSTRLTDDLSTETAFARLGPKVAIDGATPLSFDWPEDTEQLWDKVSSVYYHDAPSNFSGKLRLYAQARYGRAASDSWGFGVPSNTNGSTSGYGLYTDDDYKYWLVYVETNPTGTSVTIRATLLNTDLYGLILPIVSDPNSSADKRLIAEAYALSRAYRTGTVLTATITPPTPIVTIPLAYNWHWLWDGSEARIVVHYNNYSAGQNYISKYFRLSLGISDNTITASISLLSQGTWAPGTGLAYVFSPLAGWGGSVSWAYGFNGANTAAAPLYCYVKSHESVQSNDQEFVLVTGSFGVSFTQTEYWLSSCNNMASWGNSYVSNLHGKVSGYSGSKASISTSDGGRVEGSSYTTQKNVYRRENVTLLRVDHGNSMATVSIRNIGATPCGAPPAIVSTVTNARYRDDYIYSFTAIKETYFSNVHDTPILIIPIGNPDSCVLGEIHYEYIAGGYTRTAQAMKYVQITYILWDGRSITEGWKETSYWGAITWTLAPDIWNISGAAVYKTSFGDASTTGSLASWTDNISLNNSATGNVAMIVQGVTNAARCAGAGDAAVFVNGFPSSVGTGKAACIGFG